METNGNILGEFYESFYCKSCNTLCRYVSDYKRHIATRKHSVQSGLETNGNQWKPNSASFTSAIVFSCENCNKNFKNRSGLWKHKQKCNSHDEPPKVPTGSIATIETKLPDRDELIMYLIKENTEFKNMLMEQQNMVLKVLENGTNNHINNMNVQSNNNKTFNLQFFLNETCKDAMNIMDFVDSIKLQLTDLERIGEVGFVEGISNIITTNLKALDISQRPIHCTDKKRETIYIKDENKWEKEDDNKTKLRKAIKRVANKNIKLLPKYREKHPDYGDAESKISDKYSKMVIEAMGGDGKNDTEKEDKIIHNISKNVIVEK